MTNELYLKVKEADEADFEKSLVRIHKNDKPRDIKWGDYIDISLNKKDWVTCKLEPAGETGHGRIYISVRTRGLINRHTLGFQIARVNEPCNFYIRKAIPWKAITFISLGVMVIAIVLALVYAFDLL